MTKIVNVATNGSTLPEETYSDKIANGSIEEQVDEMV